MNIIGGIAIIPILGEIVKICMYFSVIVVSVKASQALNIYINKNKY